MRRGLIAAVAAFAVLAAGHYIADSVFKNRFPTTDLTPEEINAANPLVNTAATLARAQAGETAPFRVLFYGQSITGSGWPAIAMAELQERYPDVAFQWENRAIGGFNARRLIRTVEADLIDLSPDLIVFHVYGRHRVYEQIVKTMMRNSAADIILQTDHIIPSDGPSARCRIGLRLYPVRREACTGWPFASQVTWFDYMSYHFIPAMAERYGLAVQDVRSAWNARLEEEDRSPQDLLMDDIHPNEMGKQWMAEIFVAFFENIDTAAPPTPRYKDIPLPKPDADGTVTLTVEAFRVEAVSHAPLDVFSVTIDDIPVAQLPGCVAHGRPTRALPEFVWPAIMRVGGNAPLVPEIWTTELRNFSEDYSEFEFSVSGSVTGPDGLGMSSDDFRSNSGRVHLDASDWTVAQVADLVDTSLPDPLVVKWQTRFLCDDVTEVSVPDSAPIVFTTLVTGLEAGLKTLRLSLPEASAKRIDHLRLTPPRLP
ncbi:MAG: hypothetical protein V2I76_00900 [Roseobacter sp.]|jgi:hypothetical protein|nr:hypothetical protein [Roseobacter sp.]